MRLTQEREKEIRKLSAEWAETTVEYHDYRDLLSEIDAIRTEIAGHFEACLRYRNESMRLRRALEKVLEYCEGGHKCAASDHSPCHIHEHRIAREALHAQAAQTQGDKNG